MSCSNNALQSSANALGLPLSVIHHIVHDPSSLAAPTQHGLTVAQASYILEAGYTSGFRAVFNVNAALAAAATVITVCTISHSELVVGEEKTGSEKIQLRDEQERQGEGRV
ncbi:hypothetical protein BD626DRAFT_505329 [Schizophyllum amplum]|uniref:Uncharacterized protein n=1 Tax=Schizophyllum amplum TaxID=97359 RepID=A0A550C6K2_9AGAR|nr:hypothetical protein BD626DRAFT_505329 [Auriculariopsis ampla]